MENFAAGSVVQLKSGGPTMTIKFIEEGDAYCEWFSGDKVEGHSFPVQSLKPAQ
ncbi:YodC family protein [Geomesophilobacter sediminis]|uniref:DUF2158 domain-containing protein n=1 Tax=Geomesophilobacter sediminis TaxID=2798584 RepID=A0A8J7M1A7_9BACT|nr:DUF2158 domain-containing protein [Geomesophilobacter sediminis]